MIGKLAWYDAELSGYLEKRRIRKLKGVKAKELMIWTPCSEIFVDDPPTGKIQFKAIGGLTSPSLSRPWPPTIDCHCYNSQLIRFFLEHLFWRLSMSLFLLA
ncbi:hypothetical protein BT93_F2652 [Corymbia citriodora subsp. variegata]|nr:hypothetical protein BT93_F2652 [Corymbia citriodora subsp. variegata]